MPIILKYVNVPSVMALQNDFETLQNDFDALIGMCTLNHIARNPKKKYCVIVLSEKTPCLVQPPAV